MAIYILFGPPTSGISSILHSINKTLDDIKSIDIGEEIRYEVIKNGSTLGKLLKKYLDNGELIPKELIGRLIISLIEATPKKHYIFKDTGLTSNIDYYIDLLFKYNHTFDKVFQIIIPRTTLIERLTYIMQKTRIDTHSIPIVINEKIDLYNSKSKPFTKALKDKLEIVDIDGEGTIEDISEKVIKEIII